MLVIFWFLIKCSTRALSSLHIWIMPNAFYTLWCTSIIPSDNDDKVCEKRLCFITLITINQRNHASFPRKSVNLNLFFFFYPFQMSWKRDWSSSCTTYSELKFRAAWTGLTWCSVVLLHTGQFCFSAQGPRSRKGKSCAISASDPFFFAPSTGPTWVLCTVELFSWNTYNIFKYFKGSTSVPVKVEALFQLHNKQGDDIN